MSDLINKADEALYRAKKEDRDPVSLICKKDYREN